MQVTLRAIAAQDIEAATEYCRTKAGPDTAQAAKDEMPAVDLGGEVFAYASRAAAPSPDTLVE